MVRRTFDDALAMGRTGELMVSKWLQSRGFYVIPSYDYTGAEDKAPRMHRGHEGLIVPDLDTCKDGSRRWVEVKTKTEPVYHRKTGTFRHGIDRHQWESYLRIQRETGCKVHLCIIEQVAGIVLMALVDRLREVVIHGEGAGVGMVYFPRDAFTTVELEFEDCHRARSGERPQGSIAEP